jgi:hypothetical protein
MNALCNSRYEVVPFIEFGKLNRSSTGSISCDSFMDVVVCIQREVAVECRIGQLQHFLRLDRRSNIVGQLYPPTEFHEFHIGHK